MATLQSRPLATLNLDTRKISINKDIEYYDADTNIANIFLQIYQADNNGVITYLDSEELSNYTAKLFLIKPITHDFKEITGVATTEITTENGGGVLKFVLPKNCTNRYGAVKCEMHISKGDELLASDRFVYSVYQSLVTEFDDSLLEDSDFPVLQQLIKNVQKVNNIDDTDASAITTYSGNKIENIKSELGSQIKDKATKQEVDVERKRIDTFTSLTQGSTTGDAELIDGRIGADGNTYDNIGNAIRGQYKNVADIISLNDNVNLEIGIDNSYMQILDSGQLQIASNNKFAITKEIPLKKYQTIEVNAQGYITYVSMITKVENGAYTTLAPSIESAVRTYEYTADEDMNVVVCFRKESKHSCRIYTKMDVIRENLDVQINPPIDEPLMNYMPIFLKIAGIGDSLMSGEHCPDNLSQIDMYNHSWLSYIARRNNLECVHYSVGGETTKDWLTRYKTQLQNDEKSNLYFIGLGCNDKNYQDEIPTGTIDDDKDTATYVGYYKNIIDVIHTKNPNAAIMLVSMYDSRDLSNQYSSIIRQISDLYEYCFYIDFINNCKGIDAKNTGLYANNSHFTTLGYLNTSYVIEKLVNKIVAENLEFFKWYGYYNN